MDPIKVRTKFEVRSLLALPVREIIGKKGKVDHAPSERRWGAHLPLIAFEPVANPLKSVTHGQCDARPTVTFPAAEHHRPLAGTKLYCLVTGAHGCWQLAQSR